MPAIATIKELAIAAQPLLLAAITFGDGEVLRVSSHPCNTSEGGFAPSISGFPHTGLDFLGRLAQQDLDQIQSISDQGVDQLASITLHIADPDGALYQAYQRNAGRGFKGADVSCYLVTCDLMANPWAWSTDYQLRFVGVCNKPGYDGKTLTVSCVAKLNLQKKQLPVAVIQPRCIWVNPTTTAQRADASNEDSTFYECGETRDLTTAPPCSYTEETCTQPNRFSGVTWRPPDRWRSRGYLDGKTIEGTNSPNDAKYGEPFPMLYGTTWVEPPILNVVGDANSTRVEVALCIGHLGGSGTTNPGRVRKVLINDTEIPFVAYSPDKPIFRWEWVATGARDGAKNQDAGYDGLGNPYGSIAVIEVVFYRKLAGSESIPGVRVLVDGPDVRVYSDATTFAKTASSNPAWIILDLLTWCGVRYDEVDLASFVDAAAWCATTINFTWPDGSTRSHARYDVSLALREKTSAAEVVQGLLRAISGNLLPNPATGKLSLRLRRTAAQQQPSAITGSNNASPISGAYSAYDFDASSIVKRDGAVQFNLRPRPISDIPNRVSFQIQDKWNDWQPAPVTITDTVDVARVDQEVAASINFRGINSFDHAYRAGLRELREMNAEEYEFETSVKGAHLRVGDLIRATVSKFGFSNQWLRIRALRPAANIEGLRITAYEHDDARFADTFGQGKVPASTPLPGDTLSRPPYPWQPDAEAAAATDPITPTSEKTFALSQNYAELGADGSVLAAVRINGVLPVTTPANLEGPVVNTQATISTSGGSLAGLTRYLFGVTPLDADGRMGRMSLLSAADVNTSGSSHSITIPVLSWAAGTAGYRLFCFIDHLRPAMQAQASGTPSSITFGGPPVRASFGPPDVQAAAVSAWACRVKHSGLWGAQASAVGTGTITIAGAAFSSNEYLGYDVSIIGRDSADWLPVASFRVTGNDADTLTVTPDPSGVLDAGDVLVMRSKPSVSGLTLTDARWENNLSNSGDGLEVDGLKGKTLYFIAGPGRGDSYVISANDETGITIEGDWLTTPTSASRYIVLEPGLLPVSDTIKLADVLTEDQTASLRLEVSNYRQQVLLVGASVTGRDRQTNISKADPARELYVFGRPPDVRVLSS